MTCTTQVGNSLSRDIAHFRPCPSFISTFFHFFALHFWLHTMLAKAFQQNLSRHLPSLARRTAVVSATRAFSGHSVVKQATVTTPSNGNYLIIIIYHQYHIDVCKLDSLGFETSAATPTGRPIYLDMQATSPTDPRVLDAMLPYMTEIYGNPHSRTHQYGWETETAVENARAVSIGIGIHM